MQVAAPGKARHREKLSTLRGHCCDEILRELDLRRQWLIRAAVLCKFRPLGRQYHAIARATASWVTIDLLGDGVCTFDEVSVFGTGYCWLRSNHSNKASPSCGCVTMMIGHMQSPQCGQTGTSTANPSCNGGAPCVRCSAGTGNVTEHSELVSCGTTLSRQFAARLVCVPRVRHAPAISPRSYAGEQRRV